MKIRRFTEENDWEGETWNFYIQGTEAQFMHLQDVISDNLLGYTLSDETYSVDELKQLIKYTSSGYMDRHNDFGTLTDKIYTVSSELFAEEDGFYKGGIGDYTSGRILKKINKER